MIFAQTNIDNGKLMNQTNSQNFLFDPKGKKTSNYLQEINIDNEQNNSQSFCF